MPVPPGVGATSAPDACARHDVMISPHPTLKQSSTYLFNGPHLLLYYLHWQTFAQPQRPIATANALSPSYPFVGAQTAQFTEFMQQHHAYMQHTLTQSELAPVLQQATANGASRAASHRNQHVQPVPGHHGNGGSRAAPAAAAAAQVTQTAGGGFAWAYQQTLAAAAAAVAAANVAVAISAGAGSSGSGGAVHGGANRVIDMIQLPVSPASLQRKIDRNAADIRALDHAAAQKLEPLDGTDKVDVDNASVHAMAVHPKDPATGKWRPWVLKLGTKQRNETIRRFGIGVAEAADLKQAARRHKQNAAQVRYLKRVDQADGKVKRRPGRPTKQEAEARKKVALDPTDPGEKAALILVAAGSPGRAAVAAPPLQPPVALRLPADIQARDTSVAPGVGEHMHVPAYEAMNSNANAIGTAAELLGARARAASDPPPPPVTPSPLYLS